MSNERWNDNYLKIISGQTHNICVDAIAPRWRWVRFSRLTSSSASYRSYVRDPALRSAPVAAPPPVEPLLVPWPLARLKVGKERKLGTLIIFRF